MRQLATITLIAVAPTGTIHRAARVAECAWVWVWVWIRVETVFAFYKRRAISGKRRIIRHECTIGGSAGLIRVTRALTVALVPISTIASATTTAIATWAAGTILLLAIRADDVDDGTIGTR